MTRALAEPSVSRFTDLEVEAKSEATILELPHSNQSIEAERDRILSELARELHDQLAQPLNGLLMQTEVFIREQQGNRVLSTYQLRTGIKVNLWVSRSWPTSLPPETSIHLYRIIQEALTNAHKHGGAGSVQVALQASRERLVVKIRDDGRGIAWLDEKPIGMGMVGMRERAALSGGLMTIRSRRAAGTTITVSIPRGALRWSPKHVLPAS